MCHFAEISGLLQAYHLCTFQGTAGYVSKTLVMWRGHLAQTMSEILGKEMDAKGKSIPRWDWGTINVCLVLLTVRQVEETFLSRRRLSSLGGQQSGHISCLDRPWAEWQILSVTHITVSCLCSVSHSPGFFFRAVALLPERSGTHLFDVGEGLEGKRGKNRLRADRRLVCYDFLPC